MVQPGEHEGVKAAVHAALGSLALVCAVYNGCAWIVRRERHLAVNLVLYAVLVMVETQQTARHVR